MNNNYNNYNNCTIILFLVLLCFLYCIYEINNIKKKYIENFVTTTTTEQQIDTAVKKIYLADVEAIRLLSNFAIQLSQGGFVIPGPIKCTNDLHLGSGGNNPWTIHAPQDNRNILYIARKNNPAPTADWDWTNQFQFDGSTGTLTVKNLIVNGTATFNKDATFNKGATVTGGPLLAVTGLQSHDGNLILGDNDERSWILHTPRWLDKAIYPNIQLLIAKKNLNDTTNTWDWDWTNGLNINGLPPNILTVDGDPGNALTVSNLKVNKNSIIKHIAGYRLDDRGTGTGYYKDSIFCSTKNYEYADQDNLWIIFPGYKVITYDAYNYSSQTDIFDNKKGTAPTKYTPANADKTASYKVYYFDVEVTVDGIS
jgi:hypothetical protein